MNQGDGRHGEVSQLAEEALTENDEGAISHAESLGESSVLVGFRLPTPRIRELSRLRWIHLVSAGADHLLPFDWLPAHVRAVQFEQIEGVEKRLWLVPPMPEQLEYGKALIITAHHLAVDQAGPDLEVVHGLDHEGISRRPVMAVAG